MRPSVTRPQTKGPMEALRYRYDLRRAAPVSIRVFDVRGSLVRALADGPHGAGSYEVPWPGVDAGGRRVVSAVYYYRVQADDAMRSGKIAIVR